MIRLSRLTPSYMAPEQASGKTEQVGKSADVYALGAILYCALTGRPPFVADTPAKTIWQLIHDDPTAPRKLNAEIPIDLEAICLKCLEKNRQTSTNVGQLFLKT